MNKIVNIYNIDIMEFPAQVGGGGLMKWGALNGPELPKAYSA